MCLLVNLQEDEKLAKKVIKYPCIYDRASQHYKDKRKVVSAWKRVGEQLDFWER